MTRVRIKHARPNDLATRRRLLHVLAPEVKVIRLIPARDAIIVITGSDADADLIFTTEKLETLSKDGFSALMPPTLRAQRSVVCVRLDDLVYEHGADEILDEVEREQSWAKVQEVYKFPRSKNVKITFQTSAMAKKATESGLLMFCMSLPSSQVHQEEYIELLTCTRCYAVEDHTTRLCTKPHSYTVCSNCAEEGHHHWECRTPGRRCLNCNEGHHATAMKCPVRKRALKEKQDSLRRLRTERASTSYAQASSSTATPSPMGSHMTGHMTGLMCLMHAHIANIADPGSFQKVLTENLKKNGLPDVTLTPIPRAAVVFSALVGGHVPPVPPDPPHRVTEDQEQPQPEGRDHGADSHQEREDHVHEDSTSDSDSEGSNEGDRQHLEVIIVKKDSDTWPRTRTFSHLERGLREGRYKIRHNMTSKDTELVIEQLRKVDTPLSDLFTSLKDADFSSMESGPFDPSEPARRRRRRNKKRRSQTE